MKGTVQNKPNMSSRKHFHTFGNICFMIRYLFKYTPKYIVVLAIEVLCGAFWNVLSGVWFVKYLFGAIEAKKSFKEVLLITILVFSYRMLLEGLTKWEQNIFFPKSKLILHETMQKELYMKAKSLDLACYDDPEYYNDFIWAIRESDTRALKILSDIKGLLSAILTTLGMIILFITIDWIVILSVLLSTLIGLLIKTKLNEVQYQKSVELNPKSRKLDYIKRVFYLNDYSKELRLGRMGQLLQAEYGKTIDQKIDCARRYAPKILRISLLSQLSTNYLFDGVVTGYLIVRYAIDSNFSLGDFSAAVTAIWKFFVNSVEITSYVSRLNEHGLYVDKFRKFVEHKPQIVSGHKEAASFEVLELQNVSFSYPNRKAELVLNNLSISIRKGEKVAFVGYNGAGKTTLTKLIMRLYDPACGNLKYNGKDIKQYDLISYRSRIGAVFQDYKIFAATIAENVLGGEFAEERENDVLSALKASTFLDKLHTLPQGIKTQLTREFDKRGINLSGGETQKIAISRVFANPYELIIMDEPSSALDPLAEYELNNSICEFVKDKTVIFISHRLSTTRMVDRIYMFKAGEIIEQGSHEELMQLNGEYAKMFTAQAERYCSKID